MKNSRREDVDIAPRLTRCFHCGGTEFEAREVEELISATSYVVRCKAPATVCRRCGERYFDPQTVRGFEEIRGKVSSGDLSGLRPAGTLLEPAA
jgi:YgiT-type zinc finger domain-containing protein